MRKLRIFNSVQTDKSRIVPWIVYANTGTREKPNWEFVESSVREQSFITVRGDLGPLSDLLTWLRDRLRRPSTDCCITTRAIPLEVLERFGYDGEDHQGH